jgi:hypothetical protein
MTAAELIRILNVLVPILAPAVAAVVVSLKERQSRRSTIGRRKLVLEDARAQVAFVSDWLNASRALDVSQGPGSPSSQETERLARAWLDGASGLVADNELVLPPVEPVLPLRRLALLYEFRSTAGKVVRAVFWIFCGLTTTTVGTTISQWISPEQDRRHWAGDYLIVGTVVFPLTVALRFVATRVDDVATRPPNPDRQSYGVLREVLLLRPLWGRAAGLVRVLFYVALTAFVPYLATAVQIGMRRDLRWLLPLTAAGLIVYGTATLGIRAWAVSLDRMARRASVPAVQVPDTTPGQVSHGTAVP